KKIISARGELTVYGNVVVFSPKIPLKELNLSSSAGEEEVPGLLPDTTYTVFVPVGTSGAIANLTNIDQDAANPVSFKTGSIPQLYFVNFPETAPNPVSVDPGTGTIDVPVNTLQRTSDLDVAEIRVSFDGALNPERENLEGFDGDGDGWIEPNFFLRYSDPLLFVTQKDGSSLNRLDRTQPEAGYLTDNQAFKFEGETIPLSDLCFDDTGHLIGLSQGRLFSVDYRTTEPTIDLELIWDSGRPSLKGLQKAPGGPWFSVDMSSNELVLLDIENTEVRSVGPLTQDGQIKDLVMREDGRLYLLWSDGSKGTVIDCIDPLSAETESTLGLLGVPLVSMALIDHERLCLLDAGDPPRLWLFDLSFGAFEEIGVVDGPLCETLDLTALFYDSETEVSLIENRLTGSTVVMKPKGIMPFNSLIEVMVKHRLQNLRGLGKEMDWIPLASEFVGSFTTEEAPSGVINDAFIEDFSSTRYMADAHDINLVNANWNYQDTDETPPHFEHLVAGLGLTGGGQLGDFLPLNSTESILLDTDYQPLPLYNAATPNVTQPVVIRGGEFHFRNIHIPAGVTIFARGTNPLVLTATGEVVIEGTIDLNGIDGAHDNSFDSAFVPTAGGGGSAGAGRGGASQPPWPANFKLVSQLLTAPFGETGWGSSNKQQIGGRGGQSGANSFTIRFKGAFADTHSRGAGGGGGSLKGKGICGVQGKGKYVPDDYGNALSGTPMGGASGDVLFMDGNPNNDYFGPAGEIYELKGGQGGGGGGVRWDSLNPQAKTSAPPNWPACSFDGKGGGGGGGGGALAIHALGSIRITETGKILACGGVGGRGEMTGSSNFGGAGGGGSGGTVILQSGTSIILEESSDPGGNKVGATIDVSGGQMGDAKIDEDFVGESPSETCPKGNLLNRQYCSLSYGDGGQGGFGIIQLMVPDPTKDLIPAPADWMDAKISVGATLFDADPDQGEYSQFSIVNPNDGLYYLWTVYERQLLTYEPGAYPKTFVFGDSDVFPFPPEDEIVVEEGPVMDPFKTLSNLSALSYGLSEWIDLGAMVRRPKINGMPSPVFKPFKGTDSLTGVVPTINGYVVDYFLTGPGSNDIEISAPDLGIHHFIPDQNEVAVEFQGARAAVPGLSLPGTDQSTWTADLSTLSGYQFLRFRIKFDVAKDAVLAPTNTRPQVDKIRIRLSY
ncbi:MAG: hypothetical protein KJ645_00350, partial [Planctomycetes bacterium]|nr:hypothetical protein [Planctomycetota bacterium]